jgi:hypothetical protein
LRPLSSLNRFSQLFSSSRKMLVSVATSVDILYVWWLSNRNVKFLGLVAREFRRETRSQIDLDHETHALHKTWRSRCGVRSAPSGLNTPTFDDSFGL